MPESVQLDHVEYVTTAQAAEHFAPDVTADMVQDWVKRGLLQPAGRHSGRSNVFRLPDVAEAERQTRTERRGRTRRNGQLQQTRSPRHNLRRDAVTDPARKPSRPRCTVVVDNRHDCHRFAVPDAPFRICREHMEEAYLHWLDHRVDIYRSNPGLPYDPMLETLAYPTPEMPPLVYYIRFGDRIKIGYTTSIEARLANLPHDELLAIEPGPMDLEKMRHQQFKHAKIRGEWFHPHPDLLSHIEMLIEHYGPADAQLADHRRRVAELNERGPDGRIRRKSVHPRD